MDGASALFLILMGCSDDLGECSRVAAVAPVQYVSANSCQGGQEAALLSRAARMAEYPTVIAKCVSGKQLAAMDGQTVVDLRAPRMAAR